MKYIKKINEGNGFSDKVVELVKKTIHDNLDKVKLDKYHGDDLYIRDGQYMNERTGFGHSSHTMNEEEEDNPSIKYRYTTRFKKFFNVRDKNPIDKQVKIYKRQIDFFNNIDDIMSKLDKISYYSNVRVMGSGKNYLEFEIITGFSEEFFNIPALKKINEE